MPVSKWKLNTSLETKLSLRPISLRNVRERAKFKIQEGIVRGFRDYLLQPGLYGDTHSQNRGQGSRGRLQRVSSWTIFIKPAVLEQSPQFYKQMMVGVL